MFREIWRLLLLAAAIGVRDGVREPLKAVESGKAMPETYFSTPAWRGFLYLIAIGESGDSDCLHSTPDNQDKLVTVFEEYANYGLRILKDRIGPCTTPLDELTSFILEAASDRLPNAEVTDLI